MTRNLYGGRIAAAPFCPDGGGKPCQWCDYRAACRRAEGEAERAPDTATADPFDLPAPDAPPEEDHA